MSVHICDRCGDITVNTQACTCNSPNDQVDILRRRDIVIVATRRAAGERPHLADAGVSSQRAELR